jgi:hypothetical protein
MRGDWHEVCRHNTRPRPSSVALDRLAVPCCRGVAPNRVRPIWSRQSPAVGSRVPTRSKKPKNSPKHATQMASARDYPLLQSVTENLRKSLNFSLARPVLEVRQCAWKIIHFKSVALTGKRQARSVPKCTGCHLKAHAR